MNDCTDKKNSEISGEWASSGNLLYLLVWQKYLLSEVVRGL